MCSNYLVRTRLNPPSRVGVWIQAGLYSSSSDFYAYSSLSNRLNAINGLAITLDSAGNTVNDLQGTRRFEYNQRGQLSKVYVQNTLVAAYVYNALGQRTRKVVSGAVVFFHYDLNGTLLGHSSTDNTQHVDYIGFDNRVLAQFRTQTLTAGQPVTTEKVFLHTDHLNSPRIGTNTSGSTVWRWPSDAFGLSYASYMQANAVTVNLRFPGQFSDSETRLYYNYHRYYNPQTGRYISSDPIGLAGGLNTFGYVGGNPLRFVDPLGLVENLPLKPIHTKTITSGEGRYSYEYWKTQSTSDIVKSLEPGNAESLKVKSDGRIMNGNTRVKVLEERGCDINKLPRVIIPILDDFMDMFSPIICINCGLQLEIQKLYENDINSRLNI